MYKYRKQLILQRRGHHSIQRVTTAANAKTPIKLDVIKKYEKQRTVDVENKNNNDFPEYLRPGLVISIRPERFEKFMARVGNWAEHFQLFPGTDGRTLKHIKLHGKIRTHGQWGCHDSHVRAWRYIVEQNLPQALICEDDTNITDSQELLRRIYLCLAEVSQSPSKLKFDVFYFAWSKLTHRRKVRQITAHVAKPLYFLQLNAYVLTNEGAQKLLRQPETKIYTMPVDVLLHHMANKGVIKSLCANPPICGECNEPSDTNIHTGIK